MRNADPLRPRERLPAVPFEMNDDVLLRHAMRVTGNRDGQPVGNPDRPELTEDLEATFLAVRVTDAGPGLPEDSADRRFELLGGATARSRVRVLAL